MMLRVLFIPCLLLSSLAHAQWNDLQVGRESFVRNSEALDWVRTNKADSEYDAYGNLTGEINYFWTGNFWQVSSERNQTYDTRGRVIASQLLNYDAAMVEFELIRRFRYQEDERIYSFREFRRPNEGKTDIDITNGINGKGQYTRERESYENDELISSAYFRTEYDESGNRLEGYSKFFEKDEPLIEFKDQEYYNADGCPIGSIAYYNQNGNGWTQSDSTRIVPLIGCQNKYEEYRYNFRNNSWQLQNVSRQEVRYNEAGDQIYQLQEVYNGVKWDTLFYQYSVYNSRGNITEYYIEDLDQRARISYQYSNNFLTTSYLVEVDEKFLPGGFRKTDSVHIQLNENEQLLRQANFNRLNGMFALSQEILNTYDANNQVKSRENYFRTTLQEERTLTEYTYRCDGQLIKSKESIIEKIPSTGLGNQSLNVYYYMRNDACTQIAPSGVTLYPNPADNYVGVELPEGATRVNVRLMSTVGQVIDRFTVNAEQPYFRLDMSKYEEGMYVLQIESDQGREAHRLLIKR